MAEVVTTAEVAEVVTAAAVAKVVTAAIQNDLTIFLFPMRTHRARNTDIYYMIHETNRNDF